MTKNLTREQKIDLRRRCLDVGRENARLKAELPVNCGLMHREEACPDCKHTTPDHWRSCPRDYAYWEEVAAAYPEVKRLKARVAELEEENRRKHEQAGGLQTEVERLRQVLECVPEHHRVHAELDWKVQYGTRRQP